MLWSCSTNLWNSPRIFAGKLNGADIWDLQHPIICICDSRAAIIAPGSWGTRTDGETDRPCKTIYDGSWGRASRYNGSWGRAYIYPVAILLCRHKRRVTGVTFLGIINVNIWKLAAAILGMLRKKLRNNANR